MVNKNRNNNKEKSDEMVFRRIQNAQEKLRGAAERLFLLVLLLCSSVLLWGKPGDKVLNRPYADLKPFHFGFSVGLNYQDLEFSHNGKADSQGEVWGVEIPDFSPGICANVLADYRLHKYLNLRVSPGMYFGSKTIQMRSGNGLRDQQILKQSYVVLPVDLKISGERYDNIRPYVLGGVMETFDIGKKRSDFLQFNTMDTYLTLGFGCDFYHPYFKFIPEVKFCFGLTDVLRHQRPDLSENPDMNKITESLNEVRSNMVVFTFYFE